SVILVLTAGQQLHNQIGGVLSSSGDLFRILETMRHFAWLVRYVDEQEEQGTVAPASALREGIRLDHLCFRYPGADPRRRARCDADPASGGGRRACRRE